MNEASLRRTLVGRLRRHQMLLVASALVLLCVLVPVCGTAVTLGADPEPSWPDTWILLDEDANDTSQAYRDVLQASCAFDDSYVYVRLSLEAPVDWSTSTRYKWFFNVDGGDDLAKSGNIIQNASHLLFIEDTSADGTNDVYLLDSGGDGLFNEYEPAGYATTPGPTEDDVAGWSVVDNNIDLYVSLAQLGLTEPASGMQLAWATDGVNNNLAQAAGDTPDDTDIPLVLQSRPRVELTATPEPVEAGGVLTYTAIVANDGTSPVADASANEFEVLVLTDTSFVDGSLLVDGTPDASAAYDAGSGLLTWNGSIPPGGQVEISYQVNVDSPLVNGTTISSQATVWYDSTGDGASDSSALSDDPRTGAPGDACVSTVSSAPVLVVVAPERLGTTRPGRTVGYDIAVENQGNAVAKVLLLDLALPPELSIVAVEPPPPGDGSTIWTAASLSPLDGTHTVHVSLRVDRGLRRDMDLAAVASLTCSEGASALATTTVPSRVYRDNDDDDDDRPRRNTTPSPEEEPEAGEPEAPQEPEDASPPPPPAPSVAVNPVPSAPGTAKFDIALNGVPTDGLAAWVYFDLPEGLTVTAVALHHCSRVSIDGNRVAIQLAGQLEADAVATLTVAPIGSAPEDAQLPQEIAPCPVLYAVLHTIEESEPQVEDVPLLLTVLNVGNCPARDVVARVELPPHISIVRATTEDAAILSVTRSGLMASFGILEVQTGVEVTLGLVNRQKGLDDSNAAEDPLGSAVPRVTVVTDSCASAG